MKKIYTIMFFLSISLAMAATIATIFFGLKFGVDFKGGSVMEIRFDSRPTIDEIYDYFKTVDAGDNISINPIGDRGAIFRLNEISESVHQSILTDLGSKFGKVVENRFDSVGPTVGSELRQKSLTAVVVLLLAIIIYIAFVFRKMSKVLSSWAMSLATVIALLHDVIIPIGVFALLGHYLGVEISAVFVAAILTILGYSVSDSIVVFDRVRENVLRFGSKEEFGNLVHKSIMQTLTRSLNTTFTTLLSLVAIYFFGGESVKFFALALIMGIFLGAYSSIFVAAPILVWWSNWKRKI